MMISDDYFRYYTNVSVQPVRFAVDFRGDVIRSYRLISCGALSFDIRIGEKFEKSKFLDSC